METKFSIDRALPVVFESSEVQKRGIEAILEKYNLDENSSAEDVEAAINKCMMNYRTQIIANLIRAVYYPNTYTHRIKVGWC